MRSDAVVKLLLAAIAVFLGLIALRPYLAPPAARAQAAEPYPLFIEPGTFSLLSPDGRSQQIGKVVVDLRNGNVWGFPTLSTRPYPVDSTKPAAPVSHPMYLGQFDFAAMNRPAAAR